MATIACIVIAIDGASNRAPLAPRLFWATGQRHLSKLVRLEQSCPCDCRRAHWTQLETEPPQEAQERGHRGERGGGGEGISKLKGARGSWVCVLLVLQLRRGPSHARFGARARPKQVLCSRVPRSVAQWQGGFHLFYYFSNPIVAHSALVALLLLLLLLLLFQLNRDETMTLDFDAAADKTHIITLEGGETSMAGAMGSAISTIQSANLNVLVFCDIGMEPATYFLALHRIVPTQVGHRESYQFFP